MELRVLEYFLTLAQEGSVSAAAEALHVSQPTLSRQLMDLERELGTTLFLRGRRGITLTEDGMLLRRRAAELLSLANIAKSELAAGRDALAGEIRIGCAETRAVDVLARLMRQFRSHHPRRRLPDFQRPRGKRGRAHQPRAAGFRLGAATGRQLGP